MPEPLEQLVDDGDSAQIEAFYHSMTPGEMARALSILDEPRQRRLLTLLGPEIAADVVEELSHAQAADLIEELSHNEAAAIIDELPSDEQADILGELDEGEASAIIEQMAPEEAADARLLTSFDPETAGGLMISEFLRCYADQTVEQVLQGLRENVEEYREYDVQYLYVVERDTDKLVGVGRIKDLVLSLGDAPVTSIIEPEITKVSAHAALDALKEFFDRYDFYAAPVVDDDGRLLGAVRRVHVEEALGDRAEEALMRAAGIVGGEELRTMPVFSRAMRRLMFLMPNVVLSLVSITIIAVYEPIIDRITSLAVFLPLVANLSGAAGNQAVAVSIRELSLGIIEPRDWFRVCTREAGVGALNGLIVGAILGAIAGVMRSDLLALAGVIGLSYALNSILAVVFGGTIPLVLRGMRLDPAMASSPLLTTVTDAGSFFLTLSFAAAAYASVA